MIIAHLFVVVVSLTCLLGTATGQDADSGDSQWQADLQAFGYIATMTYKSGKQVTGKYGPELEKKLNAFRCSNPKMSAIAPAIVSLAKDIDFQERVWMGLENPRPLTPDELAERASLMKDAFMGGLGDEDAEGRVYLGVFKELAKIELNRIEAERMIYRLRGLQVNLWEQLLPEMREHSGAVVDDCCLSLEHVMVTAGTINNPLSVKLNLVSSANQTLKSVVIRIDSRLSEAPGGEDTKFLFVPVLSRKSEIELPGNFHSQMRPNLNNFMQNVLPGVNAAGQEGMMTVAPGTAAFTVSMWCEDFQFENVELELAPKPTSKTRRSRVRGGPVQMETTTVHRFIQGK